MVHLTRLERVHRRLYSRCDQPVINNLLILSSINVYPLPIAGNVSGELINVLAPPRRACSCSAFLLDHELACTTSELLVLKLLCTSTIELTVLSDSRQSYQYTTRPYRGNEVLTLQLIGFPTTCDLSLVFGMHVVTLYRI